MKYDSGMKQFRNDIIAVLWYMLKDDKELAEKFSPKDGSPAPMRDYLKQKYGKSRASHIGDGIRYCCNFSKGLELTFDTILNNPGDKNLTLSWSQTAKFIRDNWDEVFKKPETEELPPQLSYIDKLREKYPKVSETDDWFDTVYCPSELFDGDGVNDPGDEKCDYTTKDFEACQKCWREQCPANIEFLTDPYFEKEYFENYPKEETDCENVLDEKTAPDSKPTYKDIFLEHYPNFDVSRFDEFINSDCRYACAAEYFTDTEPFDCNNPQSCKKCWYSPCESNWNSPDDDFVLEDISDYLKTVTVPENESPEGTAETENQLIPQSAGEISETFNYAVLSSELGDFLKHNEQQLKNEYMNFTANCGAIFAEAQEKLAGSNQYNGLFEKWINSMGFKKDTVYRMINVHKFCSSQIATSSQAELFDSLSKSLQYEIAKPSAPAELVEQVLNGDITTHKDYIALKKQLEEARSETETAKRDSEKNSAKLAAETAKADELKRNIEELNEKNTRLALEIVKLEKRPVDVIVDSSEVNKRVAEAVSKINSETEQTLAAREQEFADTLHFKDERIWALEDKLKELGGSPGTDKKIYLLSMTDEDYRKMLAELNGSSFRNILEAAAIVDIK